MTEIPIQTAGAGESARCPGRKELTQERIVQAAIAIFEKRGYESASVAAIAERAGVSRSAVFWHFGDKQNLFRESFQRLLMPLYDEIKLEEIPAEQRVEAFLDLYDSVVSVHRNRIQPIVGWVLESDKLADTLLDPLFRLHDRFADDLADTFVELGRDETSARQLARAIVTALDGGLLLGLLDPARAIDPDRSAGLRAMVRAAAGLPDER